MFRRFLIQYTAFILGAVLVSFPLLAQETATNEREQSKLALHVVPTPIKSYRLLAMSMDDDGFIWAGSIHKGVHRYDPRMGKIEDFPMPFQATASACICVGK